MKKIIMIILAICLSILMVSCTVSSNISENKGTGETKLNQTFYSDAEKVEIYVGDSKVTFEQPKDVKEICDLFENIVGNKVPSNMIPTEGYYEISFCSAEKKVSVILTGETIIVDGVEYYTTKNIIDPLSKYLE